MTVQQRILVAMLVSMVSSAAWALPRAWGPGPIFRLDGGDRFEIRGDRDRPGPQGRLGIEEKPASSKGLIQALWRSAVLPGWGQRYLGASSRGWAFMAAEATVWATWGTFKNQERLRLDNSIEMAEVFAGVSGKHDDAYYKQVGQQQNWQDYNQWLRWQARREYGFGTDSYYAWIAENEIAAEDGWEWRNEDRRIAYVLKRKASKTAAQRATNTLFALIVTRVAAMVDSWRLARIREDIQRIRRQETGGLRGSLEPTGDGLRLRLGWSERF